LPATSAAGMTQVATVSAAMAKNDGTYFKLLSANVMTLSECGRHPRLGWLRKKRRGWPEQVRP
jgi:hypothetical protein